MNKSRIIRTVALLLAAVLVLGIFPATAAETPAGTVIDVTDYGADPTGVLESTTAVEKALEAAKALPDDTSKTIYFPEGEYHFYADYAPVRELYVSNTLGLNQNYKDKHIGILVEDLKNVTIDGGGSMFVYHGDITTFAVIDSENVTFTNFSFDHASPSVVDITVESQVEGENAVIFSVPSCYDYEIVNGNSIHWIGEVGPATGKPYWEGNNSLQYCQIYDTLSGKCWRGGNPFSGVTAIEDLGGGRVKFTYNSGTSLPTVGYSYEMRNTTRTTPGALIWQSSSVTLKNINAHYLHGFGIVGQLSKDITLDTVSFRARPESGRTTAGFADFVQMSSVGGKVTIKNCDFSVAHDDPINIHGTFLTVEEVSADGKTLTVKYNHGETAGFPQYYEGDQVDFSTKGTMVPVANSQRTIEKVIDNGWGKDTMTIVLNEAVEGLTGGEQYVIENVTYTPEVEITGCRFANIPTRGILVTTRKPVLIENNIFDAMNMASIYISCDAQGWYESGHTENVTIRNNIFMRPGTDCILVEPTGSNDRSHQLHSNMTIEGNTFLLENSVKVVNAKSVTNLVIRDNSVVRYQPDVTLSLSGVETVRAGETAALTLTGSGASLGSSLYRFENCTEVTLENNRYDGGLNQNIDLAAGTVKEDLTITGDDLTVGSNNQKDPLGTVYYVSSDPSVLTVNSQGVVTGVSEGTATVTAMAVSDASSFVSNSVTIQVKGTGSGTELPTVQVSAAKNLLDVENTLQMQATASDQSQVTWSVRGEAATIDASGLLTAKKSGVVEVVATTESGASGSTLVAVRKAFGDKSDAWTVDRDANNWSIDGETGALTINAKPGGDWATGNSASSIFLTAPDGSDFTAVVKLHNKTTATYEEAGLIAFTDNDNYVALQRKHANGYPNVAVVTEQGGSANEDGSISDTFGDTLWLKLVKDSDTLTGYYSENGTEWTEIRSVTNSGLNGCKVGVIACNSTSDTPFTFSDFTLDNKAVPFAAAALEPEISQATASISGSTAQLSYSFAVKDSAEEGASVIRWYASETENGAGHPIADGTSRTLTLTEELVGKYVWAQVAPVDELGRTGAPVTSSRCQVTALAYDETDATLRQLELGAALVPGFSPDVLTYTAAVPETMETLTISAAASNPESGVQIDLDGQAVSGDLALTKENHVVTVTVTAPSRASKTYTVNLRTVSESRAVLSGMTLGDLAFDPAEHYYQLLCQDDAEALRLSLSAPGCGLTVRYRNEVLTETTGSVENLTLPLQGGLNDLEITVTAPDGMARTLYRVCLVQKPSGDATLSSLTVDGAAVPGFTPEITTYKLNVTKDTVKIAAAASHSGATVAMVANGKQVADGQVTMDGDMTEVTIRVTAEDGSSRNYTLLLLRSRTDNASLLDVSLPGFDPDTAGYSLTLHQDQLTVTAEAMEETASIRLETALQQARGTGKVTAAFDLQEGENCLTATVTAPDGKTTKTYTFNIMVVRATYLSDLDWTSATTGDGSWNGGQPAKDMAWESKDMAVPDESGEAAVFDKGIGTHANSTIVYDLTGSDYATFTAKIGVSYAKYGHSDDPQLIFRVLGDGEELYKSGVISSTTPYVPISVDIRGVATLTLEVQSNKSRVWSAHGNWADAILLMSTEEAPTRYAVTVEGENAWTDRKQAAEGDVVTIFLEEGIVAKAVTVQGQSGDDVAVEPVDGEKAYRFTMPAEAVTVTVTEETHTHSGGEATCVSKAKCAVCGAEYGEKDRNNHKNVQLVGYRPATVAQVGYTGDRVCQDCETVLTKGKEIPKLSGGNTHPIKPVDPVKPSEPDTTFVDVRVGDWYEEAVAYVAEAGLMTGVGNGKFNPDGAVTRAMVWTVLARMDGENTEGGSTWYSKAQAWAMETGVSDGTNPMGSITREQLAAMLYRFEGSPAVSGNLSAYPDANQVSDWAVDAMVWATEEGIINGMGGNLSPKTGATRAQLAAMLQRYTEQ